MSKLIWNLKKKAYYPDLSPLHSFSVTPLNDVDELKNTNRNHCRILNQQGRSSANAKGSVVFRK